MSKKPKIEFYVIDIHPILEDNDIIRNIFRKIYLENLLLINPDVNIENLEILDDALFTDFFRHFFSQIDQGVVRNESKRKAFKAYQANAGEAINESIVFSSVENLIHGIIKGGEFDTGKHLSEIDNPESEIERLGANKLITDD